MHSCGHRRWYGTERVISKPQRRLSPAWAGLAGGASRHGGGLVGSVAIVGGLLSLHAALAFCVARQVQVVNARVLVSRAWPALTQSSSASVFVSPFRLTAPRWRDDVTV